ncbi:MAG: ferrous iron transporter B, partial [Clostridia bacterium]|nr:ferrous iron transporter B [Clostridia bacterium]
VLSFLPQVVLLFFFLSLFEDSGYLSRIAFIFEDILGKIGLSGKSVYTLLMGFGCSTTAIMTARNMDDKNAKIKTAILCPYMSCSAKIPIYTVIGGAFFGASNILVIMGLYFLGVVVALAISKILDLTVLKSKKQSFILEFPPYRMTSPKRVGKILWKNVKEFLIRVGSVMIAMNIIIWVLSSFTFSFAYVDTAGQGSMLETIGKVITPIFAPLGFGSWAIIASLVAGLVAKEVVVSSIAMFNGIDTGANKLISNSILLSTSLVCFKSKASVLAFLVFCLLYTPCVASISMLLQEIGKKWTLISIAMQLVTAYVVALIVYNVAFAFEIFGFVKCFSVLLVCFSFLFAVIFIAKKIKNKKICGNCQNCNNKRCNKK